MAKADLLKELEEFIRQTVRQEMGEILAEMAKKNETVSISEETVRVMARKKRGRKSPSKPKTVASTADIPDPTIVNELPSELKPELKPLTDQDMKDFEEATQEFEAEHNPFSYVIETADQLDDFLQLEQSDDESPMPFNTESPTIEPAEKDSPVQSVDDTPVETFNPEDLF